MSDSNTLGSLVRKRRLESGYSLGQLASKVGKTAAEVRAWERDTELPEHGIIERLAATLEIDLGEIKDRLEEGRKALEAERAAAAAAAAAAEAEAAAETAAAEAATDDTAAGDEAEDDQTGQDAEELPGFAVEDPFTPPTGDGDKDAEAEPEPGFDLLDAPTEAVPVPVITGTATAARAGRAAAVLEAPPPALSPDTNVSADEDLGLLRYLEPLRVLFDPNSRYLYWIRAGLTTVVMLIFVVILMSQLGNLLDAISELLDTIEPIPGNPDDINVLGFGRSV